MEVERASISYTHAPTVRSGLYEDIRKSPIYSGWCEVGQLNRTGRGARQEGSSVITNALTLEVNHRPRVSGVRLYRAHCHYRGIPRWSRYCASTGIASEAARQPEALTRYSRAIMHMTKRQAVPAMNGNGQNGDRTMEVYERSNEGAKLDLPSIRQRLYSLAMAAWPAMPEASFRCRV